MFTAFISIEWMSQIISVASADDEELFLIFVIWNDGIPDGMILKWAVPNLSWESIP